MNDGESVMMEDQEWWRFRDDGGSRMIETLG